MVWTRSLAMLVEGAMQARLAAHTIASDYTASDIGGQPQT